VNKIPVPQDSIFEFQCDISFCEEYLQKIKESKSLEYMSSIEDSQHSTSSKHSYWIPKHEGLFSWLEESVNQVAMLRFESNNLSICDAWITKTLFGGQSMPHAHYYSIYSGILYLNDHDTKTEFFPTDYFFASYMRTKMFLVKENVQTMSFTPKAGTLLIFPSYLNHKITVSRSKTTRYTLAFNTFFDGITNETNTAKLSLTLNKNFHEK
jgi:uncharacterized protein (TIGR02466 family)